jgi:hypothetical protein
MFFGFRKSSFGEHKVVTKVHIIPENQRIASHAATVLLSFVQKIVACDVLVFWDVMIFCNNFAR